MKKAHQLANIIRMTEKGSPERKELLEALEQGTIRHYGGMEVCAGREHHDADDYRTYKADVLAFEDDSMVLRLCLDDGSPPLADPFDLDDPYDALRAAALLEETQLGPTMMAFLTRAIERNADWLVGMYDEG